MKEATLLDPLSGSPEVADAAVVQLGKHFSPPMDGPKNLGTDDVEASKVGRFLKHVRTFVVGKELK